MKRNMSNTDRTIRIIIAALIAYLYFGGVVTGTVGIILVVLGAVFLLTSIVTFCPLYVPFKFSTYKEQIFQPLRADESSSALFLAYMNITEFQKRITQTEKTIVVDFWANWCVPCKITKPVLEKLADEYSAEIEFVPIDADLSRDVLEQFKVIGIPTVLAIRNGEVSARITGAQNEASYRAMFEALAEGRELKVPMSALDRMFRLGAGILLVMYGVSSNNWLVLGIGGIIAFLGIYDRCPIWNAITGMIQAKTKN